MSENVHRIRHNENLRLLPKTRRFHALEDLHEQRDIPVNQIEAGFIWFAAQACRYEENVAVSSSGVIARVNPLVSSKGATVKQIEGFAVGQILVRIEKLDFRHQPRALQGKRRARSHATTTTDNRNFH